ATYLDKWARFFQDSTSATDSIRRRTFPPARSLVLRLCQTRGPRITGEHLLKSCLGRTRTRLARERRRDRQDRAHAQQVIAWVTIGAVKSRWNTLESIRIKNLNCFP